MRIAIGAIVLLPLLLVAVGAPAFAMRCRTTGAMMALCACPAGGEKTAPEAPAIGGQTCCRLHQVATAPPPSDVPNQRVLLPEPLPIATLILPVLRPATEVRVLPARGRPVAIDRPSVLLAKSALLI